MSKALGILFCSAIALAGAPVWAADPQQQDGMALQRGDTTPVPSVVRLADALATARRNYPSVRAALAERVAARDDVTVARTAYLPQISLLAQINRATVNNLTGLLLPQAIIPSVTGPVLPQTGRSAWNNGVGVLASWRPFDFGYRHARVQAAQDAASAADQTVELTQLQVLSATVDAYMNVLAAQALATTAQANVQRLDAFANAARVLVTNKLRAGVESEQADTAVALARTTLISAQENAEIQKATLAKLVGSQGSTITVDAGFLGQAPRSAITQAADLASHPAIRQQQSLVDQRAAELRAINRSALPQVDLVGSASARGSGKSSAGDYAGGSAGLTPDVSNWAVGVQLSVPLGNIPLVHAQANAQRARLEAERARYDQAMADVQERIAQAIATLQSAQQIAAITPVALRTAQNGESQQRARFQSGLSTAVDVTAAEAVLAQAESQDAIARINLWRAAAALAVAQGDVSSFEHMLQPQGE